MTFLYDLHILCNNHVLLSVLYSTSPTNDTRYPISYSINDSIRLRGNILRDTSKSRGNHNNRDYRGKEVGVLAMIMNSLLDGYLVCIGIKEDCKR